ncbi:hypothetical protein THAOC_29573, partial [Thalassiosira oceanica]
MSSDVSNFVEFPLAAKKCRPSNKFQAPGVALSDSPCNFESRSGPAGYRHISVDVFHASEFAVSISCVGRLSCCPPCGALEETAFGKSRNRRHAKLLSSRRGGITMAPSPVAPSLTSTTAPGKAFASRAELQDHYKSDWHQYNLKRRDAGLPMLNEEDFTVR